MKHGLCSGAGGQVRKKKARLNYKGAQNVVGSHGSIFPPLLYFFQSILYLSSASCYRTQNVVKIKYNDTVRYNLLYINDTQQ